MQQLNQIIKNTVISISMSLLVACSSSGVPGNTDTLSGLQSMQGYTVGPARKGQNRIRYTALKESALAVGAQSALAWRAKNIQTMLKEHGRELDLAFNFQAMVLDHNVIPPVLVEGHQTLNLDSQDAIRIADRAYQIIKQAHFATTPPNWRNYILLNYKAPARPDNTLLPKNRRERKIWRHYVQLGWENGLKQANHIFGENLARLTQDYKGMALYRILLAQNMVSPPFVAKTELGVTGDASHLNINDKVLRITALPQLNTNSKQWRPALTALNTDTTQMRARLGKLVSALKSKKAPQT